jgi:hypothetical protein
MSYTFRGKWLLILLVQVERRRKLMSSLQTVTSNIVRGTTNLQPETTGLTARLAIDDRTRADAYAIRHESYLSGGYIDPQPGGLFSDADDLKPNNRCVVVYKHERPVASVRLCTLDYDPAAIGWDEIPASRIFSEEVAALAANVPHDRPARLKEINRLVRHPDFATDFQLVFVLFRLVGFFVAEDKSDMTLSCVRRNHTPFYKRMHFEYVAGPRRYAGVKFETNLMACHNDHYAAVAKDIPFVGGATGPQSTYHGLLHGETVDVFAA